MRPFRSSWRAITSAAYHTLRVTPAMEAGLTDRVWTIRELLTAQQGP